MLNFFKEKKINEQLEHIFFFIQNAQKQYTQYIKTNEKSTCLNDFISLKKNVYRFSKNKTYHPKSEEISTLMLDGMKEFYPKHYQKLLDRCHKENIFPETMLDFVDGNCKANILLQRFNERNSSFITMRNNRYNFNDYGNPARERDVTDLFISHQENEAACPLGQLNIKDADTLFHQIEERVGSYQKYKE